MLEVGWFSTKLLFKGKLLRNPEYFIKEVSLGVAIGFILLTGLNHFGVDLWLAIALSSFLTGSCMPYLLKDVKMQ